MSLTVFHRRLGALVAIDDLLRVERAIAFARVLVSTIALVAVVVDPTEPARYYALTYTLAACYAAASVVALVALRRRLTLQQDDVVLAHALDILAATVLTLFSSGPNSPFFPFFVYAVMTSAFRWGLYETLFTTAAAVLLMLVEATLLKGSRMGVGFAYLAGEFDVNRLIMRVAYLWVIGISLAYFGAARQRRREAAAITSLGRAAWLHAGHGLLKSVLGPALQMFGSRRAITILKGRASKIAVWRSELTGASHEVNTTQTFEDVEQSLYLSDSSSDAWHATIRRRNVIDVVMLDARGRRIREAQSTPAIRSFLATLRCRSVISFPICFRDAVIGRVFLIDPTIHLFERESALYLGMRIASEVGPAAHNVFRLRRLRSRAEAGERARMARELHDGLLQSIAAAGLRVDIVRRRVGQVAPEEAAELSRIQAVLTDEARSLRLLTRRMHAAFSGPNELHNTLTDLVRRFESDTGIAVRFESDADAHVPPRIRYEIVRIVQEALTNIRKHSGARHAFVRVAAVSGAVRLIIEDDGQGFSFSGPRSHRELEVMSAGPLIIRERVRALRGELNILSMPGKGTRLDVKVPGTL